MNTIGLALQFVGFVIAVPWLEPLLLGTERLLKNYPAALDRLEILQKDVKNKPLATPVLKIIQWMITFKGSKIVILRIMPSPRLRPLIAIGYLINVAGELLPWGATLVVAMPRIRHSLPSMVFWVLLLIVVVQVTGMLAQLLIVYRLAKANIKPRRVMPLPLAVIGIWLWARVSRPIKYLLVAIWLGFVAFANLPAYFNRGIHLITREEERSYYTMVGAIFIGLGILLQLIEATLALMA